ncbi:MAG: type I DNA topoisomerase [Oscillospiraceae bacterium]|nr:type I DNA topoisomerase [Oscillospiraceae bacterium]
MANLVIVESPSKANTIKGYLGSNYKVMSSVGHVRDLPKSKLGIDIEAGFMPHYINIRGKGDVIRELVKESKKAKKIFFATDADREGEAISWHLCNALGINPTEAQRVTFNEVTKTAVKEAIKSPRAIDMQLVDSQQARRLLDRIVGYKLSPYLWKTVRSGLSAGRVQSVATRLIVEREEEIRAFVPKEFWRITLELTTADGKKLTARFWGADKKIEITNEEQASEILTATKPGPFVVGEVKKSQKVRNPSAPFITSSLQQGAYRKLGFSASRTMQIAQELYEGVNLGAGMGGVQGLITYMRTDSLRISNEATDAAKAHIIANYGEEYYPTKPRAYKTKGASQDAHEAIRPSNVDFTPEKIKERLSRDQYRLYRLIYTRFLASQMASAIFDTVNADIGSGGYIFKASGSTLKFPGFLSVYEDTVEQVSDNNPDTEESEDGKGNLPPLEAKQVLNCNEIIPKQHFTEPPPRYNDASFLEELKERGIGRPSTYASIVGTILSRGYVAREGKAFMPTPLGEITNKLMVEKFADVVDYTFTAQMEEKLDGIGEGETSMNAVLTQFYSGFESDLNKAMEEVGDDKIAVPDEELDLDCELCGKRMIVKSGRFGKFAACPSYPECKNTKPLAKDGKTVVEKTAPVPVEGMTCEQCGSGMVLRSGRYGNFHACENYPKCKFIKQIKVSAGANCPSCGSDVVVKRGRNKKIFYSCEKYPECTFSAFDLPAKEKCPTCDNVLFVKRAKGKPTMLACREKGCGHKVPAPPEYERSTHEENEDDE